LNVRLPSRGYLKGAVHGPERGASPGQSPQDAPEPFNELGREQVFDDLSRWLSQRIEAD
jgi:hypothetical protein